VGILRELGLKSHMCVPLVVRGNAIGSIQFMRLEPKAPYTLFDLANAEEFTDRAAVAIDNARLYSREQEANRLKDEFLAMVSHELRTPLTPILGATYILRSLCSTPDEVRKIAEMIERNAKSEARIIGDLLAVSRIATGRIELNRRTVNIGSIIDAAIEVTRPAAEAAGINISLSIEDPSTQVYCDPERIQHALWKLLSNALKFSPSGGEVQLQAETRPNSIRISVIDAGKGIPNEFLPHLFEPFRQADRFVTRTQGGLGLGLSIVWHIVQQHGGTIRAENSGMGKGAKFTMELPCLEGGPMFRKNKEKKEPDTRVADIAKRRRQLPSGQLKHNLEYSAEEGHPVTEPTESETKTDKRTRTA